MTIDSSSEHIKEVYARYGLALYFAQVLEHGIVNALMVLDLIPSRRHTTKSPNEWATLVDGFMNSHFETTMGTILRALRSVTTIPDALDQQLGDALRRRNWLAHGFFRERAEEFLSAHGRDQMIDEVDECRAAFQAADSALEEAIAPLRRAAGITDEILQSALAEMMVRAKGAEAPLPENPPAKIASPGTTAGAVTPKVQEAVDALLTLDRAIIDSGKRLGADAIYLPDLFVVGVLNRSLQLVHGFAILVKHRQLICAAPLLRMQMDNALRLFAGSLAGSFDEFTRSLMEGERIDRMKTPQGQRLTDRLLLERLAAAADEPWLEPVYERTSGYVHLSDVHLFRAVRAAAERTIHMRISREEGGAPESMWLELVAAFDAATRLVLRVVDSWIAHKASTPPCGPSGSDA